MEKKAKLKVNTAVVPSNEKGQLDVKNISEYKTMNIGEISVKERQNNNKIR